MTPEFIAGMVRRLQPHRLATFDYAIGNTALRLVFTDAGERGGTRRTASIAVNSPGVGRLRLCHPLGGDLPEPGTKVRRGTAIAFLQAGPLLYPVTAPADGLLGAALRNDGDPAGYGDPLFVLEQG